jgi:hypothetical protein
MSEHSCNTVYLTLHAMPLMFVTVLITEVMPK